MSRIVIRRRLFNDYDDVSDLFGDHSATRVLRDTQGRPLVWHVEPNGWATSFYVTYLELVDVSAG